MACPKCGKDSPNDWTLCADCTARNTAIAAAKEKAEHEQKVKEFEEHIKKDAPKMSFSTSFKIVIAIAVFIIGYNFLTSDSEPDEYEATLKANSVMTSDVDSLIVAKDAADANEIKTLNKLEKEGKLVVIKSDIKVKAHQYPGDKAIVMVFPHDTKYGMTSGYTLKGLLTK
jgi:uncharacterized membrane protein YvbJ